MKKYIQKEKNPKKGLFVFEWCVMIYLVFTLVMMLCCYSSLVNPEGVITGRVSVLIATALTWGVYRLYPCRLTVGLRVGVQSSFMAWWYADTYELNRILPNLDHIFARADQSLFGCQPSLVFSELCPWDVFSEMLYLGYYSYFYLIVMNAALYFLLRYEDFSRAAAITFGSFFAYYIIFDLLPVTGPQYYYHAIGLDNVTKGVFPNVGSYFLNHSEMVPAPGMEGGFFRSLIESGTVHEGERPTAAFPSSHIGLSTVVGLMLLRLCRKRNDWRPMYVFTPLFILLSLATVYIHAHYLVDAIAGLITGVMFYFAFSRLLPRDYSK